MVQKLLKNGLVINNSETQKLGTRKHLTRHYKQTPELTR